jgi:hypothetical protein
MAAELGDLNVEIAESDSANSIISYLSRRFEPVFVHYTRGPNEFVEHRALMLQVNSCGFAQVMTLSLC